MRLSTLSKDSVTWHVDVDASIGETYASSWDLGTFVGLILYIFRNGTVQRFF